MPDERDFVSKMKAKLSKKQKAEKYGKGQFKAGWLEANARHLGGDMNKLHEELQKQRDWDKEYNEARRLEQEPGEGPAKKKSKLSNNVLTIDEIRRRRVHNEVKEQGLKGYVTICTNLGDINLELFASKAPKTCENFLGLCKKGYYDDVTFHRLIPGFMVQGGDPTGTGRGGQSLWGAPFEDEVNDSLSHNKEGILSMANSGANCNKSQFFMTFAKCPHLDGKHTIFGQVVGGMRVLKAIEAVDSNDANQPLKPIKLLSTKIYNNPFEDVAAKQKASSSVEKKAVAVKDNPYLQHMC